MELLIARVFNAKQVPSAINLLGENATRSLIVQEVGKQLLSSDAILPSPLDQLLAIVALANFAEENECAEVARIVHRHIADEDVLPAIAVHKGKDLGERCLLSLAFFIERMEYRTKRFSAPSPDFYRIIGQRTFHNEGLTDLSEHFYQWEAFLGEHLTAS